MSTLFMVKIGATPTGRLIEQHDMFFGVADDISELVPAINAHWSEVKDAWHIDAYRTVTKVSGYRIAWESSEKASDSAPKTVDSTDLKLFFINLGGYLPNEFEEYHHKMLVVANSRAEAIKQAKQSAFYQKFSHQDVASPAQPTSHIDDKMQVDMDDIYDVGGLLKSQMERGGAGRLVITPIADGEDLAEDKQVIGYLPIKKLQRL